MQPLTVLALAAFLAIGAQQSAASGTLEIGPAIVMVDNGHASECIEDTSGLCLASTHGDSAGGSELDLDQRVSFVGVALNRTYVNDATGYPLLPDGSMMLTPADYSIDHPVFRVLIEAVGERQAPGPASAFGVMFTEEGFGYSYLGPGLNPVDATPSAHGFWIPFAADEASEGALGRDRIRLVLDLNSTTLDQRLDDVPTTTGCRALDEATDCRDILSEQVSTIQEASPNVIVGAAFTQALVTTDPNNFQSAEALGFRESSSSPLGFRELPTEPPYLARSDPSPSRFLIPQESSPLRGNTGERPAATDPSGDLKAAPQESSPPSQPPFGPILAASIAFALAVGFAILYSRVLQREESLVTERRRAILDALASGPQTVSGLSRTLGLDRTTVEYHARLLVKASRIVVHRHGRRVILAVPGTLRPEQAVEPNARDIVLRLITENGGALPRSKLQDLAGIPLRTMNRVIKDLSDSGRIERVQASGEPTLRVTGPSPQPSSAT